MNVTGGFQSYDGERDQIYLARDLVRRQNLEQLGLLVAPEQVLKALRRHPDGLPQPQLMRWSDQAELRAQSRYLEAFDADARRAHEMRWVVLEEISQSGKAAQLLDELDQIRLSAEALAQAYPANPAPLQQILQVLRLQKDAPALLERTHQLFASFPDFLFARLSLAEVHLLDENYEQAAALFEPNVELQDYDPEPGRLFHSSEIAGFYSIMGMLHLHRQRPLRALWALALMRAALPEFLPIQRLEARLLELPASEIEALSTQLQGNRKMGKIGKPSRRR